MKGQAQQLIRCMALGLATLLFSACASGPKIYANADSSVDFSQYRTYGFFPELATDKPGYTSLESQYLKSAVNREMTQRGLSLAANPDLLVNFNIASKEKIITRTSPTWGGYYGYRGPYYGAWGGYETRIDQYTEGTLNVDVVDAASKTLVWEGAAVGRVNEDALNHLEEALHTSVHEIFKRFPLGPVDAQLQTASL